MIPGRLSWYQRKYRSLLCPLALQRPSISTRNIQNSFSCIRSTDSPGLSTQCGIWSSNDSILPRRPTLITWAAPSTPKASSADMLHFSPPTLWATPTQSATGSEARISINNLRLLINHSSTISTRLADEARNAVLTFFNAPPEYTVIFTANASAALKLVGEAYPFSSESSFILGVDSHNSVHGIRQFAFRQGAKVHYIQSTAQGGLDESNARVSPYSCIIKQSGVLLV
jgi:hypothetical protein